jgi:serine/threonine protein kinase/tetratricopeptide (TPR) repeat protein
MQNVKPITEVREQLLAEAAERYFEAAARGEQPSLTEYAQRYPQIAADIRDVFPALALVGDSIASTGGSRPQELFDAPHQLGDYRLIREIGRGGMGIVYEAEQLSLGRRVALKVLPFAATLGSAQLQRFNNEARAAAALKHPHIVGVHSVGIERGVHYYAMELIEGRSLAEVAEQLRAGSHPEGARQGARSQNSALPAPSSPLLADTSPVAALSTLNTSQPAEYFRSIAHLGIQAADALDYAHQMGIVHRDIKPSNLLVDDNAHLWITDFGLALTQSEAGLTMTGDLLGTLRYMSPEQAAGKRLPLDHRTDVYSLGATLYELLAQRPAFASAERATLLREIAEVDPPPLRKINSAIPVDLETIVSKAMEKDAADRYSSAKELAQDLRQFLENRPIAARPATLVQRATKWSRRHVAAVWAASLALLVATIGLGAGMWLIDSARDDAVAAQRAAQVEADRAQRNLKLAIESLDRIYTELIGKHLANEPRLTRVRHQFLKEALSFYERFARENRADESSWPETGRALLIQGRIHNDLDQLVEAGPAFENSAEIFVTLSRKFPDNPQYIYQSAEAIVELAATFLQLGLVDEAIAGLSAAFQTLEPGGDPATDELLAAQLETPRHAMLLGSVLQRLGNAFAMSANKGDAREAYRRALRLQNGLIEKDAANAEYHSALGETLARLAILELNAGGPVLALEKIDESIVHQQRATGLAPNSIDYQRLLRNHYHVLGSIRLEQGDNELALEAHRKGNDLAVGLARDYPDVAADQLGLAFSQFSLASALVAGNRIDEAHHEYRKCLACWKSMRGTLFTDYQLSLFYDAASYHRGSVVLVSSTDPFASLQRTIKSMLGKSTFEVFQEMATVESLTEESSPSAEEAASAENESQELQEQDQYKQAFDELIQELNKNELDKVRRMLEDRLIPREAVKAAFSSVSGAKSLPFARLYADFGEFRLGHARALLELGERIQGASGANKDPQNKKSIQ